MTAIAEPGAVTLSCSDPASLADFYAAATGWQKVFSSESAAYLAGSNGMRMGFVRIEGFEPPSWPEARNRVHLDFSVADLEKAEAELLALGADKPEEQPGEGKWTVLLDPAGYPFCITSMA
ncbi:VOC family protein [Streptomyces sp. bgisy022]|uniref:VOC family protein n=1 Tax=Streptomyces sp. bgisy022 TaxID=3413769 RepID=UPI003D74A662